MPYMVEPTRFYARADVPNGAVAVLNDHGLYWAASDRVDEVLVEAGAAGDAPISAVSWLLERLSEVAWIDIPDDNYSLVELATMIAHVQREAGEAAATSWMKDA